MREVKPLTNAAVMDGVFKNAEFVFYSEGSAMGECGNICTIQKDGTVYSGNYAFGDLSIDLVIKKFPYVGLKEFDRMIDSGISKDGKVHYYYLECGNHLFVRDDVYESFAEATENCKYCDEYGAVWYDTACMICPDYNRKEMLGKVEMYCRELGIQPPKGYPDKITDAELERWTDVWDEFDPFPELN